MKIDSLRLMSAIRASLKTQTLSLYHKSCSITSHCAKENEFSKSVPPCHVLITSAIIIVIYFSETSNSPVHPGF